MQEEQNSKYSPIETTTEKTDGSISDDKNKLSVTIQEYRKILGDDVSTEKQISKRVQYLEAFCRSIIKFELIRYAEKSNQK